MSRARARIAPLVALVGAALLLPSCASEDIVCPAVGYFQTLTVELEGGVAAVDDVKICVDDRCSPSTTPPDDLPVVTGGMTTAGEWVFTGLFPEDFTVRLFDSGGAAIADQAVDPDWVLTGGSPECGGPTAATVVVEL